VATAATARRWRNGVVPDLDQAIGPPVVITVDVEVARSIYDAVARVPRLVWGRDERRTGDMWSCNSIISWSLATAGVDVASVPLPPAARAPG